MDLNCKPIRAVGVLQQEVSGTVVLLKPGSGQYFSLEDVAGRVWELSDGSRTVAEIVTTLCAEYDCDRAEVNADVVALLDELTDEKLVTAGT
jgi:coenzyme PQQ biosynthesis protein PqqD